jgi:RNA polymerase sigma-70 factor (ECF subfamily)
MRTWLTGIALNRCRELFRRKDRNWLEVREDLELSMGTPLHHERIDLESALKRLPEGYRTVLVLHDVEGYTHDQIGDLLEVTPGTSKSQLFRARRMMRALLAPTAEKDMRIPR